MRAREDNYRAKIPAAASRSTPGPWVQQVARALDTVYFGHEHVAPNLVAQHTLGQGVRLHLGSFGAQTSSVRSREARRLALACLQALAEDSEPLLRLIERHGVLHATTPSSGAISYLKKALVKIASRAGETVHISREGTDQIHSAVGIELRIRPHTPSLAEKFWYALGRIVETGTPKASQWQKIEMTMAQRSLDTALKPPSGLKLLGASLRTATVATASISSLLYFSSLRAGMGASESLPLASGIIGSAALIGVALLSARYVRSCDRKRAMKHVREI